ncbi:MAG TPA: AAA family ATPase [Saprospiraceae bacterium]|nr:AAA family ATPase [Saprospiraceae bacterium]
MNDLHEKVFQTLEDYRKNHPDFVYITRTGLKKDKLNAGMWFLGDENYAWISWITRSNNTNHSPALRLLLKKKGLDILCAVENGFKTEPETAIKEFYKQARELIAKDFGKMTKKSETFFVLTLAEKDGLHALTKFLETTKPKLDSLVTKMGLEKILVTSEVFKKGLNLIQETKIMLNSNPEMQIDNKRYWMYAPGKDAFMWDSFFESGIMGLGWDELGDLSQYQSKDEINGVLQKIENVNTSKKNDATANYEFRYILKIGDIVIVKKGRKNYLGYGVVASDYHYDVNKAQFKSYRKVDWKKKGDWPIESGDIVLKTLTDITKYPDYVKKLIKIIGIQSDTADRVHNNIINIPLNSILYGPPGTGKTYYSILRAAEIIENRKIETYNEALSIFNSNLHNRIEFITFHQNYSYEDFIQGLRPEVDNKASLIFNKVDGIFKKLADRALENILLSEKKPEEISKEVSFDLALEKFKEYLEDEGEDYKITNSVSIIDFDEDAFRYTGPNWTHHPNGIRMKFTDLKEFYRNNVNSRKDIKNLTSISALSKHHATYYFNVYESILKYLPKKLDPPKKIERLNYVIVIDEINRANISRVFGELITLIEPDKRSHGGIPLEVRLPSGDKFVVPSNLYILGTMNTADKSIALLDIALRRRFEFIPMYPQYDIDGHYINDVDVLERLNAEIISSKGHDFQIGHSYFMEENINLIQRFNNKVIPLLMEYFMNDDKEVKRILFKAGVEVEPDSWPLRILGRRG